jgi:prolyl-tRNA synthetase
MSEAGEKIYRELLDSGIEVLYDDRKISAGIKFKDSDLMGLPIRIVIGKKFMEKGLLEVQLRKSGKTETISPDNVTEYVREFLAKNVKK